MVKPSKNRIILLSLIAAAIVVFKVFDASHYLTFEGLQENKFNLQRLVEKDYLLSVLGFISIYIVVTGLSIPGAVILTLGGGFLFGVVLGSIYVNIGATIGAILAFLFSRYVAGDWVQGKLCDRLIVFNKQLSRDGHRYLLSLRLLTIFPYFLINIFAGLTTIPLRTFIWTTAVGIFPGTVVYAFAGERLNTIKSLNDIFSMQMFLAFFLLASFVVAPVILKRFKERRVVTDVRISSLPDYVQVTDLCTAREEKPARSFFTNVRT